MNPTPITLVPAATQSRANITADQFERFKSLIVESGIIQLSSGETLENAIAFTVAGGPRGGALTVTFQEAKSSVPPTPTV